MKNWIIFLLTILIFTSCAPTNTSSENEQTDQEESVPVVLDEETGLPLNPEIIPDGEFVVEGVTNAVTVIPQDKPLFKIMTDTGIFYQINAQPVSEIFMVDGTALRPFEFKSGMIVRATVFQGEEGGLGGEPVLTSKNLTILSMSE